MKCKKLNILLITLSALSGIAANCDSPAQTEQRTTEATDYSNLPHGVAECKNEELNIEEAFIRRVWVSKCFASSQGWPDRENSFVLLRYRHNDNVWSGPLNVVASCDLAKDWVPVATCNAHRETQGLDFKKMRLEGIGLEDIRDRNTITASRLVERVFEEFYPRVLGEHAVWGFNPFAEYLWASKDDLTATMEKLDKCELDAERRKLEIISTLPLELSYTMKVLENEGCLETDVLPYYIPVWPYDEVFTPDVLKPDQVAGRNEWFNQCFPSYRRGLGCDDRPTTYRLARHKYLFSWIAPTTKKVRDFHGGTTCDSWLPIEHCAQAQESDEYDYFDHVDCERQRQHAASKLSNSGQALDVQAHRKDRTVAYEWVDDRRQSVPWTFCFEMLENNAPQFMVPSW